MFICISCSTRQHQTSKESQCALGKQLIDSFLVRYISFRLFRLRHVMFSTGDLAMSVVNRLASGEREL